MTLKTIGTLATTTLHGAQFSSDPNALSNADFATLSEGIYAWSGALSNTAGQIVAGALSRDGILMVYDEMLIKLGKYFTGHWIATDQFGTPFFIPKRALPTTLTATGNTTSTSPTVTGLSATLSSLGWVVGTHITGTGIPANTVIGTILSTTSFNMVTINAGAPPTASNATATNTGITLTAGTFTHS